jgi:tetratricopeptide (TPR) repeat protein
MATQAPSTAPGHPAARGDAPLRTLAYRAALFFGIPLALFASLEGGLRLAGYGGPASFLIPDDKPGYFRTNPDFASLFLPGNFDLRPLNLRIAARKAPNTVRIVVLGESAAQGVPVPSFAFAPQLRAQLRARYPGREFEVIDTGIVAINSHVVYQIAREMARFEPDLFLVYMGNNEVVGPYGPGCAYLSRMPPLWVIRASVFARSTRTGQLLGSLIARMASRGGRPVEWGGMSMFVDNAVAGDDPRLGAVYRNFADNLRGIVRAAGAAGARTVLCTVVANLKDCPPFLSVHRPGLSQAELAAWEAAFRAGSVSWKLGDAGRARPQLGEALRIDAHYAATQFMLGSLDLQAGDTESARRRLTEALHWDALRFRPDAAINEVIRRVAGESGAGVSLLDLAAALGSDPSSTAPVSGRELLFEHVHFDWPGNYQVARMMARSCAASILGGDPGDAPWLDSDACAAALAYTPHERLPMLLGIDVLVRRPPFTNQLTHVDDEARMARDLDLARGSARGPEATARAAQVARAALARDPGNPAIAGVLEGIDLDLGDANGALALSIRVEGMLPRDYAAAADRAAILMRLGRNDEAGRILVPASASGADLDNLVPVLSEYWTRTRRFDEGRRFLDAAIARRPGDRRLPVARASLLRASGDSSGAEREFRAILAADPASAPALEGLVAILLESGRGAAAEEESLAAAAAQPGNQENSLRAVKACEAKGDLEGSVRNLEAAELSGPVNATFELTLALDLYKLGRTDEMMVRLTEARRMASLYENNAAVADSIDKLIARMRLEAASPPQAGPPGGQKSE